jgi:hypothetical protein
MFKQKIIIVLYAIVLWTGIAFFALNVASVGLDIHEDITMYVKNEIAENYGIEDADLELLNSEHIANDFRCMYKVTDAKNDEHYISVTFLRHTLHNEYKHFNMTLSPQDADAQ